MEQIRKRKQNNLQIYGENILCRKILSRLLPDTFHTLHCVKDKKTNLWNCVLYKDEQKLLQASSNSKGKCIQIVIEWIKYLYEDAIRFKMVTEIIVYPNYSKVSIYKNCNEKELDREDAENREDIYRKYKEQIRRKKLVESPICALKTPGDMYEVGEMALEAELLNKEYFLISKLEDKNLKSFLVKKTSCQGKAYDIDQSPINEKDHENLWKCLDNPNNYMVISSNEQMQFEVQLISSFDGRVIESGRHIHVKNAIMDLELKLKKRNERKIVLFERKKRK